MFCLKKIFIIVVGILMIINVNVTASEDRKQDPKCLLPVEPGPCRMSLTRFYYNDKTDTCEEFKFGGCKGNDNKFGFKQTCETACKKSISDGAITTKTAASGTASQPHLDSGKSSFVTKPLKSDVSIPIITTMAPKPEVSRTTIKTKSLATSTSTTTTTQKSNIST